jgi:hypothetical protein
MRMSARTYIKLFCLTVLTVFSLSAAGQDFNWARRFPLIGGSYKPFIEKHGGSFFIGGTVGGTLHLDTITLSTSGVWGFVAGLDSLEGTRWMKPFRSHSADHLYAMTSDLNGNIVVGGYYDGDLIIDSTLVEVDQDLYNEFGCSPCFFGMDGFLASIDTEGKTRWIKSIIGLNNQAVYKIKTDSKNNVIAGAVVSFKFMVDSLMLTTKDVSGYRDRPYAFVFKFSPDGKLLWYYECPDISIVDEIIIDSEDNIYLLKEINSGASGVVKLTPDGEEIYDVEFSDYKIFMDRGILDRDDNLILAGTRILEDQEFVTMVMKIREDGEKILWKKEYHGMMDLLAMEGDSSGYFYIGGAILSDIPLSFMDIEINGQIRYCYAKFNCTGELEWYVALKDQNVGIIGDLLCEGNDLYICGYTLLTESGFAIGDSIFSSDPNMLFIASFTDNSSLPCTDTITADTDYDFHLVNLNSGTSDIADFKGTDRNFIVYPTVVDGNFNIEVIRPYDTEKIQVEIISLSGSVLFQEEYDSTEMITVRCPALRPGFYIVLLSGGSIIRESYKILVIK